jgi:hypothetical protein
MSLLLVPIKSAQGPTLSISDKSLEETTGSSGMYTRDNNMCHIERCLNDVPLRCMYTRDNNMCHTSTVSNQIS